MNKPFAILAPASLALILAFASAGPAQAQDSGLMYSWLSYERDMYLAYSDPENEDLQLKLAATLLRIIEQSDRAGRKPPPGIVAEYGYFHFERGEYYAAIDHFRREATQWPESKTSMDRMIRKAPACSRGR